MLRYYVKIDIKRKHKKYFDTQTQAEKYYRYLQNKYNTNAIIIGVDWK